MLDLLLFSFFIFLALAFFAIGVFAKVPYPCMIGGGILVIVAILLGVNGLTVYDGSKNYTISATDANKTTSASNYYMIDNTTKFSLAAIFIPVGILSAFQGILIGRSNSAIAEGPVRSEIDEASN